MELKMVNGIIENAIIYLFENFFIEKGYKPTGGSGRLLVKFLSHRSRDAVFKSLKNQRSLCSFKRSTGHGVYEVTPDEFEDLKSRKKIKFSKFKDGDDLLKCRSGY